MTVVSTRRTRIQIQMGDYHLEKLCQGFKTFIARRCIPYNIEIYSSKKYNTGYTYFWC